MPATDFGTSAELPLLPRTVPAATRALPRAADAAAAALLAAAAARVSASEAFSRAMDASKLEFRESRGCWARLESGKRKPKTDRQWRRNVSTYSWTWDRRGS